MPTELITCPFSWGKNMIGGQDWQDTYWDDVLRIGQGDGVSSGGEYVSVLKFDFSPLLTGSIDRIESVNLKMYIMDIHNTVTMNCIGYRILKNATSLLHWYKYDGVNNWSSPGAKSAGNDYDPAQLGTREWASIGYSTMFLSPSVFREMVINDRPMVLFSVGVTPPPPEIIHTSVTFNKTDHLPYIEVVRRTGVIGGIQIF